MEKCIRIFPILFSKYNHFIRYIYPFNDTIFQIIDHKPHPLYYIEFEDKKSK